MKLPIALLWKYGLIMRVKLSERHNPITIGQMRDQLSVPER
jgi:hypothetical protein